MKPSLCITVALTLALFLTSISGCRGCNRNEEPEEYGTIYRDTAGLSGPADPKHGSGGIKTVILLEPIDEPGGEKTKIEKKYKNCKEMRPIQKGDLKTAEGTLYKVFEALLIEDDNTSFETFYSYVDSDFKREAGARKYWFKNARMKGKGIHRLVFTEKNPGYMVCEVRPERGGAVRIFVGKSPPVGSNPPYVLHKVGDRWLIKNFTPH